MVAASNSGSSDSADKPKAAIAGQAAARPMVSNPGEVVYMRLLDYVVSQALEECSRALLLTSRPVDDLPVHSGLTQHQLRELEASFAKLMAAWQLVRKRIGKSQYRQAAARVTQMFDLLPAQVSFGPVAQNLLDRASPGTGSASKTRAALRQVMDEWSSLIGPAPAVARALPFETLNRLLQEESTAWRLAFAHRGYSNKALVVEGFGRTYRRARRMGERMVDRQRRQPLTEVQLRRWRRRVVQVASQLELMGDNLSDANKRTLWYLHRLERNLARQAELIQFAQQLETGSAEQVSKKAMQRVLAAVAERAQVLQRRGQKLQRRGLQRGTTAYCRSIAEDSAPIRGAVAG